MKTTEERIEEIVKMFGETEVFTELDDQIIRLQLENLVTQAKLEQLRGDKE